MEPKPRCAHRPACRLQPARPLGFRHQVPTQRVHRRGCTTRRRSSSPSWSTPSRSSVLVACSRSGMAPGVGRDVLGSSMSSVAIPLGLVRPVETEFVVPPQARVGGGGHAPPFDAVDEDVVSLAKGVKCAGVWSMGRWGRQAVRIWALHTNSPSGSWSRGYQAQSPTLSSGWVSGWPCQAWTRAAMVIRRTSPTWSARVPRSVTSSGRAVSPVSSRSRGPPSLGRIPRALRCLRGVRACRGGGDPVVHPGR